MLRLVDLKPEFLKLQVDLKGWLRTQELIEADGIVFLCPKCFTLNGGPVGTHSVICWQPHVPQEIGPKPGRWKFHGTGFADLSLVAGSSSVLLMGGCNAHFFVREGRIEGES